MKNFLKYRNITVLISVLFFAVNINALTICPVQGLDKKVCPKVVDFFDQIAKHDTEFAKHWQNHHWVSKAGDNYKPAITIKEHVQMSFTNRYIPKDLTSFIESVLTKAAKGDSGFQQVLDSQNFFTMTVQAMHLELQKGADHFNRSGSPMISLQNHHPESSDLMLQYTYDIQIPETDKYLNSLGIYYQSQHRYLQSTHIDSTSYKAGDKVSPVIVNSFNPTPLTPKQPKVVTSGEEKTVLGTTQNIIKNTLPQNISNGATSINKKPPMPGNKGRVSTQNVQVPTPKPQINTNIAPPVVTYNVPKPLKVSGKSNGFSKIIVSKSKVGKSNPKVLLKRVKEVQNNSFNSLLTNINNTIQNTKPSKVILQVASKGTNKNNINNLLITQVAGSQIENNSRHYVVDENLKIWSCKVSSLGYRVTSDVDGKKLTNGHVETIHVKATQFSHIPSNHASGNRCLISVHK